MNLHNLMISDKKKSNPMCSAVILAAGNSVRMGEDKTMLMLGGIPVLARTLQAFQNSEYVDEIVVVSKAESLTNVAELCQKYQISKASKIISGGSTRCESSLAGTSEVKKDAKLIAIHDGARPLVMQKLIADCITAASKYRSVVPVIKIPDTLKLINGDKISGTIDRECVVRVQTPQVFDADLIKGALTYAVNKKIELTDDSSAMELLGVVTYTIEGDESNIKLTLPGDILIAEEILKEVDKKW